ncbi:MAG: GNAT family N-acetyltransferase [Actinomycetota bacterium]|nr:GNAT family N-acetyltransferase [Actinomycetota bacterium]
MIQSGLKLMGVICQPRISTPMARVLLLHHILGVTPGMVSFKERLERLNIEVVMPDLFDGRTFEDVEAGQAYAEERHGFLGGELAKSPYSLPRFDAVIAISYGAMAVAGLSEEKLSEVEDLIYIASFVPPPLGRSDDFGPRVTVIASKDDPFFAEEDHSSFLEFQSAHPESNLYLFAGESHFFIDDSREEFSQAMTDITIFKILEVLGGKVIGDLGESTPAPGGEVVIIETSLDDPSVTYCTQRYRQELFLQIGVDPVTDIEWQEFCKKGNSHIFLAKKGDLPLGTVTLAPLNGTDFEVKRLWVEDSSRGLKIGRRLMERLEAAAISIGCERILLDTHNDLVAAVGLYRSLGYKEDAPYNSNERCQLWMSKRLR